jgi:hypothetical protein
MRALGLPEISRQYVKSGGTVATSSEIAAWKGRETGEIQGLKRTIAEQAMEIAKLKAELEASRDMASNSKISRDPKLAARTAQDADRARRYRARKRAKAGK